MLPLSVGFRVYHEVMRCVTSCGPCVGDLASHLTRKTPMAVYISRKIWINTMQYLESQVFIESIIHTRYTATPGNRKAHMVRGVIIKGNHQIIKPNAIITTYMHIQCIS